MATQFDEYSASVTGDVKDDKPMTDEDLLREAREKLSVAVDREDDFREEGLDDLRFARLGEQWPEHIRQQREKDYRPVLTENRLPTFIRQVVNDVRQNKPGINVYPADDGADVKTAEIFNGLIRQIQVSSDADVATDTAAESAVSNGWGYFRINLSDDGRDIKFERVINPFTIFGDPHSEAADSSDWNCCFVTSMMSRDRFRDLYKGSKEVDWNGEGYTGLETPWRDGDEIMVCEYWKREQIKQQIGVLSNGKRELLEDLDPMELALQGVELVDIEERDSHKVTQYLLTGAEVLETNEWPGVFIPIVPIYGDEITVEGRRYFRSLINQAKDAQRRFNYWMTMGTELVALAPKAPWIGEEGAFDADDRWATANNVTHPYLEYTAGKPPPQRQSFTNVPAGVFQEMMNAAEGMKAILGIYDASLGNRSNETSGIAIKARQAQGDVSTYHFIDNVTRAIRHAGRILIDLIPKVYNHERIIRVLGEDMQPQSVRLQPGAPPQDQQQQAIEMGQAIDRVFDLNAGKYDLVVKAGANYSTLREQTREELVQIMSQAPDSASILGPMYLRNSDWPGAAEAADKLEQGAGIPPEVQQQMEQLTKQLQEAQKGASQVEATKAQAELLNAEAALLNAKAALQSSGADMIEAGLASNNQTSQIGNFGV